MEETPTTLPFDSEDTDMLRVQYTVPQKLTYQLLDYRNVQIFENSTHAYSGIIYQNVNGAKLIMVSETTFTQSSLLLTSAFTTRTFPSG